MERHGPIIRIALGLVVLTCSIVLIIDMIGLLPEPDESELANRIQLCETLASQALPAAERGDFAAIRASLEMAVRRNPSVISTGIRTRDGRLLMSSGDHRSRWNAAVGAPSSPTHVQIPLYRGGSSWAQLEVRFANLGPEGYLASVWEQPVVRVLLLFACLGFVAYLLYLKKMLRHLDPSAVVPTRVKATLDVMAEGVLLVDSEERIVLANNAFANSVGRTPESLLGLRASTLGWKSTESHGLLPQFPWIEALREGLSPHGTSLCLDDEDGKRRVFLINSSPILDGWKRPKGAIVTFDDVSIIEMKSAELEKALVELEKSRDEVRLQNEELALMARRDPLTGVSNRSSFLDQLQELFASAKASGTELVCLMVEIDQFKELNDRSGHAAGDDALRNVSRLIAEMVGSPDRVCRFGGTRFCAVLVDVDTPQVRSLVERMRDKTRAPGFARVPITASFGVAQRTSEVETPFELLERADCALRDSIPQGNHRVAFWEDREG